MSAVTGPYAHEIFEKRLGCAAGTVRNGTPLPGFRRPSSRPQPRPRQGAVRHDDGRRRARFRRGVGWRRRSQPDHRQGQLRHAVGLARDARRQRPSRAGLCGGLEGHRPLDADQRARPTASPRRSASACTRRRPAGSSSAICSTPAWRRSAARKAPAPARTMSARRTGCGRCCSGSTSWPARGESVAGHRRASIGRPTAAIIIAATIMKGSRPSAPMR